MGSSESLLTPVPTPLRSQTSRQGNLEGLSMVRTTNLVRTAYFLIFFRHKGTPVLSKRSMIIRFVPDKDNGSPNSALPVAKSPCPVEYGHGHCLRSHVALAPRPLPQSTLVCRRSPHPFNFSGPLTLATGAGVLDFPYYSPLPTILLVVPAV